MNTSFSWWPMIIALGLYHGVNPAMGWPLAVANGMTARRTGAVFATLLPLGVGHLLAMMIVLVPFAWLGWFLEWGRAIRISAGVVVFAFGARLFITRSHPRFLARVKPSRLAWWSFLMATAHGAGLMLVPAMLGLCGSGTAESTMDEHAAIMSSLLIRSGILAAVLVAAVHTLAMLFAGMGMAWITYRYLGLGFLQRAWINLDQIWAASLITAGGAGIILAL